MPCRFPVLTQPTSVAEYNCDNDKELLWGRLLASPHRRASRACHWAAQSADVRVCRAVTVGADDLSVTAQSFS
jgi:hypothetical protein